MSFFKNQCSGTSVSQKVTQTIYIKNLVIYGGPTEYDVKYTPTLFQKLKSAIGLYPAPSEIIQAVKQGMLGVEPLEKK